MIDERGVFRHLSWDRDAGVHERHAGRFKHIAFPLNAVAHVAVKASALDILLRSVDRKAHGDDSQQRLALILRDAFPASSSSRSSPASSLSSPPRMPSRFVNSPGPRTASGSPIPSPKSAVSRTFISTESRPGIPSESRMDGSISVHRNSAPTASTSSLFPNAPSRLPTV